MSPPQTPSPPDFEDTHQYNNRRRPGSRLSQSISNMFSGADSSESTLESSGKRDSFYKERESLDPASYGEFLILFVGTLI